jgi:hypothetical protein
VTENDTDTAGTPRWVKAFGIVGLVLVVLVVVILVVGRSGTHGPGRHVGADSPSGDTRSTHA